MISIPTNGPTAPTRPKDFLLLKMNDMYKENTTGDALNYRFNLCGNTAYFYTAKSITVIKPEEEPDVLEFLHPLDHIFSKFCFSTFSLVLVFFNVVFKNDRISSRLF